ncbi:MAG: hypothetical protein V1767_06290 [Chloroflexota bacterium]
MQKKTISIASIVYFLVTQGVAGVLTYFGQTRAGLIVSILSIVLGLIVAVCYLLRNKKTSITITSASIERDINRKIRNKNIRDFAFVFLIVVVIVVPIQFYIWRASSYGNPYEVILNIPSHEIRNLVIKATLFPSTNTTQNGLLVEFGRRWDDVDPVRVSVNVSGTVIDQTYAWWAKPNLSAFDINQVVEFRKGITVDAFLIHSNVSPPIFTFYSIGKPLSSTNSLYLWFVSPYPMNIEGAVFQGVHFHREKDKLVLDRR